jgi:hypothetical protein
MTHESQIVFGRHSDALADGNIADRARENSIDVQIPLEIPFVIRVNV